MTPSSNNPFENDAEVKTWEIKRLLGKVDFQLI
jgi:hypothetical protein